jgi:hypothetical protein
MPSTLIYRELFGFYRTLSVSKTSTHSATGRRTYFKQKLALGKYARRRDPSVRPILWPQLPSFLHPEVRKKL